MPNGTQRAEGDGPFVSQLSVCVGGASFWSLVNGWELIKVQEWMGHSVTFNICKRTYEQPTFGRHSYMVGEPNAVE